MVLLVLGGGSALLQGSRLAGEDNAPPPDYAANFDNAKAAPAKPSAAADRPVPGDRRAERANGSGAN